MGQPIDRAGKSVAFEGGSVKIACSVRSNAGGRLRPVESSGEVVNDLVRLPLRCANSQHKYDCHCQACNGGSPGIELPNPVLPGSHHIILRLKASLLLKSRLSSTWGKLPGRICSSPSIVRWFEVSAGKLHFSPALSIMPLFDSESKWFFFRRKGELSLAIRQFRDLLPYCWTRLFAASTLPSASAASPSSR